MRSSTTSSSSLRVGAGPGGEDLRERTAPAPRAGALERREHLADARETQRLRLARRSAQGPRAQRGREVHERPGR